MTESRMPRLRGRGRSHLPASPLGLGRWRRPRASRSPRTEVARPALPKLRGVPRWECAGRGGGQRLSFLRNVTRRQWEHPAQDVEVFSSEPLSAEVGGALPVPPGFLQRLKYLRTAEPVKRKRNVDVSPAIPSLLPADAQSTELMDPRSRLSSRPSVLHVHLRAQMKTPEDCQGAAYQWAAFPLSSF